MTESRTGTLTGGCLCGAVGYEASGEVQHHALCHCAHIQVAERLEWMAAVEALPAFERYPGM